MRLSIHTLAMLTCTLSIFAAIPRLQADEAADIEERFADRLTRVHEVADIFGKMIPLVQGDKQKAADEARTALLDLVKKADPAPKSKPIVAKWFGSNLVVTGTKKQHQLVTKALASWRRLGLREIGLEIQMLEAPKELIQSLNGRWVVEDISEHSGLNTDRELVNFRAPTAETTTKRNMPVLLQTVPREVAEQLTEHLVENKATSSQVAPRLLNEQTSVVARATQRPFVVGLNEDGSSKVRVVTAGLQLKLRAHIEGNLIQLMSEISYSQVTGVENQRMGSTFAGKPRFVQVPEVQTSTVRTVANLTADKCHLVGGIPVESKDGKERLMLLVIRAFPAQPAR